ncbi:type VI immunity family protein [Roseateles chitinivorans]|uniref:type VI immunity family protein n=1 Tax=Roseateles chitinivorans TaxID=2917965 RepID=UPI003D66C2E2
MLSSKEQDTLVIAHPGKGAAPARACFEIVLFYDAPRAELKAGLEQVVALCLDFLARRHADAPLGWYRTNTMSKSAALKSDPRTTFDGVLGGKAFVKPGIVGLHLHAGPKATAMEAPSLELLSLEFDEDEDEDEDEDDEAEEGPVRQTFVRLCLPPSTQPEGRELFELAAACAAAQSVYCGHAGYSWIWDSGDTTLGEAMGRHKALLIKRPAMGYHDPLTLHAAVGHGLIQVGWLTLLGPAMAGQAQEAGPLQFGADSRVGQSTLPDGGVMLVAGPEPIVGSRDPADDGAMAPYRAIGQRLAGLRMPDDIVEMLDMEGFDDDEVKLEWYLRFFGHR